MDARRIGRLRRDIERELRLFDDCFGRSEGREHLRCYVNGQVSELRRKCVEVIADQAGFRRGRCRTFLPRTAGITSRRWIGSSSWWRSSTTMSSRLG